MSTTFDRLARDASPSHPGSGTKGEDKRLLGDPGDSDNDSSANELSKSSDLSHHDHIQLMSKLERGGYVEQELDAEHDAESSDNGFDIRSDNESPPLYGEAGPTLRISPSASPSYPQPRQNFLKNQVERPHNGDVGIEMEDGDGLLHIPEDNVRLKKRVSWADVEGRSALTEVFLVESGKLYDRRPLGSMGRRQEPRAMSHYLHDNTMPVLCVLLLFIFVCLLLMSLLFL